MARSRSTPTYRFHKTTGKAIVTYYQADGQRRSILLPGAFNSKESLAEYKHILAVLQAKGEPRPRETQRSELPGLTVAELIERYWAHVQVYYRRIDGSATQEVSAMMYSLRPLNHLHGDSRVNDFGASGLKAVRDLMVNGYQHPQYGMSNRHFVEGNATGESSEFVAWSNGASKRRS